MKGHTLVGGYWVPNAAHERDKRIRARNKLSSLAEATQSVDAPPCDFCQHREHCKANFTCCSAFRAYCSIGKYGIFINDRGLAFEHSAELRDINNKLRELARRRREKGCDVPSLSRKDRTLLKANPIYQALGKEQKELRRKLTVGLHVWMKEHRAELDALHALRQTPDMTMAEFRTQFIREEQYGRKGDRSQGDLA